MNRLELLKDMLQKNPEDIFLNYAMAMEQMSMEDFDTAARILLEIKNKNPEYLPLYYQLGICYESLNQNTLAIEIYQAGIEIAIHQKENKTANELRSALDELE
ncbi:MAG: hypothetical protein Q8K70_11915 [Bacteroidota bacterium]|nr:hypothetical protein [Bacteroidota bacterium]